jgi:deoxyribodipyrimidine photolyase
VKRWIPELGQISPKIIHKLHEEESGRPTNYPAPIIEHALQKSHAEEMFRECIKTSSKKS